MISIGSLSRKARSGNTPTERDLDMTRFSKDSFQETALGGGEHWNNCVADQTKKTVQVSAAANWSLVAYWW